MLPYRGNVPLQSLIDHLQAGDSLADFLAGFPSVTHQQAEAFLELIAIIILAAKTNRYTDVAPLIAEINAVLPTLQIGQILHIGKK